MWHYYILLEFDVHAQSRGNLWLRWICPTTRTESVWRHKVVSVKHLKVVRKWNLSVEVCGLVVSTCSDVKHVFKAARFLPPSLKYPLEAAENRKYKCPERSTFWGTCGSRITSPLCSHYCFNTKATADVDKKLVGCEQTSAMPLKSDSYRKWLKHSHPVTVAFNSLKRTRVSAEIRIRWKSPFVVMYLMFGVILFF